MSVLIQKLPESLFNHRPHIHNMHNQESGDHFCSSVISIERKDFPPGVTGEVQLKARLAGMCYVSGLGVRTEREEAGRRRRGKG